MSVDSDSEVFEGHSTATASLEQNRRSSVSSSRRSSYDDMVKPPSDLVNQTLVNHQEGGPLSSPPQMRTAIVEWKPHDPATMVEVDEGEKEEERGGRIYCSPQNEVDSIKDDVATSPPDLSAVYRSTVTVTIDPPRDEGGEGGGREASEDLVAQYLNGGRERGGGGGRGDNDDAAGGGGDEEPFSLEDLFGKDSPETDKCDLYESLNEIDMSEDECEVTPTKIYLLSK